MTKQEKIVLGISGVLILGIVGSTIYLVNDSNFSFTAGDRVSETRELGKFDSIRLDCDCDVFASQGEMQKVEVKAGAKIIDKIKTEISGETLKISEETGFFVGFSAQAEIYITVENLEEIENNGSGDIFFDGLKTEKLKTRIGASGSLEIENLEVEELISEIEGSGDLVVDGKANFLEVKVEGSGEHKLFDLQVLKASVDSQASGDVEVNVSDNLDVRIGGSGDVKYMGDCTVTKELEGSGNLDKK